MKKSVKQETFQEAPLIASITYLDDKLLVQVFQKMFPLLVPLIQVEQCVDGLLAEGLVEFDFVRELESKGSANEKARKLLLEVCSKEDGCKAVLRVVAQLDQSQQTIVDIVLNEYRRLQGDDYDTASGHTEVSENDAAMGKFVEFRVYVVQEHCKGYSKKPVESTKKILSTETYKASFPGILLLQQAEKTCLTFISLELSPFLTMGRHDGFEWKELSTFLNQNSSNGNYKCFLQDVKIKPFSSNQQKQDIIFQLNNAVLPGSKPNKNETKMRALDSLNSPTLCPEEELSVNKSPGLSTIRKTKSLDLPKQISSFPKSFHETNAAEDCQGSGVACLTGDKVTPCPTDLLETLRKVKFGVPNESKKKASVAMNQVVRDVVYSLKDEQSLVLRQEYPGSSFEGAKTEQADEFDILIIMDGKALERHKCAPQFYALQPSKENDPDFKEYLSSTGQVDPSKITSKLFSWVQKIINKLYPFGSLYVVKIRKSGPAVTLLIESNPESPDHIQGLGKIDVDLVAAFQVLDEYFVAKPCKTNIQTDHIKKEYLWRKSYSLLEKQAMVNIDKDQGCRRQCLRLFKFLRVRDAPLKLLASYHYKLLLLNECRKFQEREDWKKDNLAERFWGMLHSLVQYLQNETLPHPFDPDINTFENIKPISLENTKCRVEKFIKKGSSEMKKIFDKN